MDGAPDVFDEKQFRKKSRKLFLTRCFYAPVGCRTWMCAIIDSHQVLALRHTQKRPHLLVGPFLCMAESEGFEPSILFPIYTLSRGAPSATRPALQFFLLAQCTESNMCALFRAPAPTRYYLNNNL